MKIADALQDIDWRLLSVAEGRRLLTRNNPLLFARVYFPHHLKDPTTGEMTLCDFHLDLLEWAKTWATPRKSRKEHRACFIAPRQSGKSTWIFLLLPMWAAAHGHRKFVAAFSDSTNQAENHLYTFKQELDTNALLRADFPELCDVFKSTNASRILMDNRNQTRRANGFIFMAKGADSAALGMKVGELRPDVLLFDDIEPGESNYSPLEARKRRETLLSDLFPLNDWAVVGIVGTTTMPDSLIDQMRKVNEAKGHYDGSPAYFRDSLDIDLRWVVDENIDVHYWDVIQTDADDNEQSLWPERWSMEEINKDRHTRAFAKNMRNRPVSLDGGYWEEDDIEYDKADKYERTILSVDPAVTTAKFSDYTGLAVISRAEDGRVYVRHAEQVKKTSDSLKEHVLSLIERFGVELVLVETNQGGDLWKQVFNGIPCRYKSVRQTEKKEVRAASAHDYYKKDYVRHEAHFAALEEQMLAFPRVPHDDVLDAVVSGVLYFKRPKQRLVVKQIRYTEV